MEWKNSSPSWIFEGVEVEGLVKSIARRTTTTTTKMKMRMAPTSTNRLSAALLLLVVTIVGCLLLTQCDAFGTTRQDRINDLCESYRDFLLRFRQQRIGEVGTLVENNPVKARVAESIFRFCENNDAGN